MAQGKAEYPDLEALHKALKARGAAWAHGELHLDRVALEAAIRLTVPPRMVEVNLKALELGRQAMAL